jgi:hypothetical protein
LRKNITLSGRRWKTHGSSKESGGKEAGKEGSGKEDRSKEEIIFFDQIILHFFMTMFFCREIFDRSEAGFGIPVIVPGLIDCEIFLLIS